MQICSEIAKLHNFVTVLIMEPYKYMALALNEALLAAEAGEVPVGAVVVGPDGRILGKGHNLTERLGDVTAHAEVMAITAAEQALGSKWLDGCTLYVTLEPCMMCAGAIAWARPAALVWGADDPRHGYRTQVQGNPLHPRTRVVTGVLAEECKEVIQQFFRQRRI